MSLKSGSSSKVCFQSDSHKELFVLSLKIWTLHLLVTSPPYWWSPVSLAALMMTKMMNLGPFSPPNPSQTHIRSVRICFVLGCCFFPCVGPPLKGDLEMETDKSLSLLETDAIVIRPKLEDGTIHQAFMKGWSDKCFDKWKPFTSRGDRCGSRVI